MRVFRRGLRFCSSIARGIGECSNMHVTGCMMASVAGNGT